MFRSGNMMRPQDMNRDVSYVPNRYFNQLYPRQQPDLFQVYLIDRYLIDV